MHNWFGFDQQRFSGSIFPGRLLRNPSRAKVSIPGNRSEDISNPESAYQHTRWPFQLTHINQKIFRIDSSELVWVEVRQFDSQNRAIWLSRDRIWMICQYIPSHSTDSSEKWPDFSGNIRYPGTDQACESPQTASGSPTDIQWAPSFLS
jgi:hypothetical protein